MCLDRHPGLFREALETGNRMCLAGFMTAQTDDLPQDVRDEVRTFAEVHVRWLADVLRTANPDAEPSAISRRAEAIFAAIGGAQLVARGRADVAFYDGVIEGYRGSGLLSPAVHHAHPARSGKAKPDTRRA